MSMQIFITLLVGCSTVSSIVTEGIKKLIGDKKYSVNLLAFIVAGVVGVACTGIYYAYTATPFTGLNILSMILVGVTSAFGSTVGYDKVVQMIQQFGTV